MTNSLRPMALLLGVLLIASSCDDGSAKVKNGTTPQAPSADSGSDAYSSSRHAPKIRAADCTRLATVFETSTQDVIATSRMRCATLGVPVDHAKPSGKQITIAFARLAATGPRSQRLGALMVNPGGPGGSGIEFLAQAGEQFPEELTKRFDIVAFDPRGVGASTQLTCLTQAQLKAWIEAKPIKDPKKARTQSLKDETTLRDACLKTSKDLFLHIGTDQVVADLEDLRIALGNEPMNFFGMSYGTDIAAGYVSRYPEHVRAIVLDGSLNPDRSLETRALGQTQSIERAMAAFIARCDASPTCPLAPTAETQIKAIVEQFEAGSTLPPAKKHGKRFDAGDFETALVTSLYEPAAWDGTYEAIDALFGPDTTKQALAVKVLSNFAAQQTGKRADGTYDNSSEVLRTVTCQDAESPLTAKEGEGIRKQLEAIVKGTVLESANDPASEVIEACTILPAADRLAITATSAAMRARDREHRRSGHPDRVRTVDVKGARQRH